MTCLVEPTIPSRTESLATTPGASSGPMVMMARGLRKAFGGQAVLEGVDFELHQGQIVLLRGDNGSGKTTLINILTGNMEPDHGTIRYIADDSPREFHFPLPWWQNLNPLNRFSPEAVAQEGIGRVWQDVRLFRAQTLRENVAVGATGNPGEKPWMALFAPRGVVEAERRIRTSADALLTEIGLEGRQESSADKISLGQSKRVAMARAVSAGAKILFLDEPLAGLDMDGIKAVVALIEKLARVEKITLVIVEHVFNQPHLRKLITDDWLLENGRLVTARRSTTHTADPVEEGARPAWLPFLAGSRDRIEEEPLPRGAHLLRLRNSSRDAHAPPLLEVRGLVVKRGSRIVIGLDDDRQTRGLDLLLRQGEVGILQAPNGWGKSTFFAAIMGLVPIEEGEIRLSGVDLAGLPPWERIHRGLRCLPADQNVFSSLSAQEVLRLAGIQTVMPAVIPFLSRPCSSLSGGQKQAIALASEIGGAPAAIRLFDEPFSMLDRQSISAFASAINPGNAESLLISIPSLLSQPTRTNHE